MNKDNLRGFFEFCFPVLLKRVFGYDDVEASWLNAVTKPGRAPDAAALTRLLGPRGPLFAAMRAADGGRLIQFLFPPERLPAHTQVGALCAVVLQDSVHVHGGLADPVPVPARAAARAHAGLWLVACCSHAVFLACAFGLARRRAAADAGCGVAPPACTACPVKQR